MENFSEWFRDILEKAEIIDSRYPIKGMGVWLPYGFQIRRSTLNIYRDLLDKEHDEVLFPLLIPEEELAKEGITVNAICPGYFDTELTHDTLITEDFTAYMKATVPLGRYGHEGELNAGAIFLASDEASYVTGLILPIDGGYTCV